MPLLRFAKAALAFDFRQLSASLRGKFFLELSLYILFNLVCFVDQSVFPSFPVFLEVRAFNLLCFASAGNDTISKGIWIEGILQGVLRSFQLMSGIR